MTSGRELQTREPLFPLAPRAAMGFYDEIHDSAAGPDAFKHLLNGKWVVSSSGAHTSISNPSKGGTAYRVQGADTPRESRNSALSAARPPCSHRLRALTLRCASAACTKAEVDAAYEGAHAAQQQWAATPLHKRCTLLKAVAALLRENREPIARCLINEIAKPAKDAMTEVVRARAEARWKAEAPHREIAFHSLKPAPHGCTPSTRPRCAPPTSLSTPRRRVCAS